MFVEGVMPGWWSKLSAAMIAVILENAAEFHAEIEAAEWMSPFSFEDAAAIQAPALVMTGGDSLVLFRVLNEQFARLLPKAETVTIPGACHAIYCLTPGPFNQTALAFIGRHCSTRSIERTSSATGD
jgi:pimeloyl-ACP methyl ester carboxylesterase